MENNNNSILTRDELNKILINSFKGESLNEALFILMTTDTECVVIHTPWSRVFNPVDENYLWLGDIVTNFTKNGIPTDITLSGSKKTISYRSLYITGYVLCPGDFHGPPTDIENLEVDVYLLRSDLRHRLISSVDVDSFLDFIE